MSDKRNVLPELTEEKITPRVFALPEGMDEAAIQKLMGEVLAKKINLDNPIPEPEVLVRMGNAPILRVGSLMFVCGQAGSRKTSGLTLLAADMMNPGAIPNSPFDFSRPLSVLYIDPEQHPADTQEFNRRVKLLIGSDQSLNSYALVEYPTTQLPIIIERLIEHHKPDCVIVDNVAQMGNGAVMDIDKAELLMRNLRRLAVLHNSAFIGIIHVNESPDKQRPGKARGHVGSEAHREADLVFAFIEDESEKFSLAQAVKARKMKPEKWGVSIDERGLPYYYDISSLPTKQPTNPDKYSDVVAKIPMTGISNKDLCELIHVEKGVAVSTAKTGWIKDMVRTGVIINANGRYYASANIPTPEPLPF